VIITLYVDDLVLASNDLTLLKKIKDNFSKKFKFMHFKRDVYHNQRINGNNMGHVHFEFFFYQSQYPNTMNMILFMETHKCVPIVMQIGLVVWMVANPHQVMFSYWEMVLLVGITKNKPLLLCHQ
jgi:hypothetical protein